MNPQPKPPARIVLGLTGGIAAYKAAELTRLFVKADVTVDVCMTAAACRFIAPLTLQALSGRPVLTDLWQSGADNGMGHIDLSRGADAIVVAPGVGRLSRQDRQRSRRRSAVHADASRATARCSSHPR